MFEQDRIPITLVVTRAVKRERTEEFERWLHGVAADAMRFEGHLGVHVVRPQDARNEYTTIVRFSGPVQLRAWLDSESRARRLREAKDFFAGDSQVQELHGAEVWLALRPAVVAPPRYKVAAVSFVGVFTLLMVVPWSLAPLLAPLPRLAQTFLACATMVTLLTYIVMPVLTRAASAWLYPHRIGVGASPKTR